MNSIQEGKQYNLSYFSITMSFGFTYNRDSQPWCYEHFRPGKFSAGGGAGAVGWLSWALRDAGRCCQDSLYLRGISCITQKCLQMLPNVPKLTTAGSQLIKKKHSLCGQSLAINTDKVAWCKKYQEL